MSPDDDKPARYSDDANLEPEREHDTHEPDEPTEDRSEEAPVVLGEHVEPDDIVDTESIPVGAFGGAFGGASLGVPVHVRRGLAPDEWATVENQGIVTGLYVSPEIFERLRKLPRGR